MLFRSVSLQPRFLCTGSSITLSASTNASSYSWMPGGATTSSINVNQGGTYTLTVTDANGCSASASSNVTAGTSMSINLSDVTFCHHDSIVLDAGYPGMSYSWMPGGQTTQSIMISRGGTYSVTVTDPAGCSGSVTIQANETPSPVALWSAPSACQGDTMYFTKDRKSTRLNSSH